MELQKTTPHATTADLKTAHLIPLGPSAHEHGSHFRQSLVQNSIGTVRRIVPIDMRYIMVIEKNWRQPHSTIYILSPSLLDLTGLHGNGRGGTGIGARDMVFVVRHGWVGGLSCLV